MPFTKQFRVLSQSTTSPQECTRCSLAVGVTEMVLGVIENVGFFLCFRGSFRVQGVVVCPTVF